jgi:hypothetical protein
MASAAEAGGIDPAIPNAETVARMAKEMVRRISELLQVGLSSYVRTLE